MDTLVVDPIAAPFAAGEGRYEWRTGSLLSMEPVSEEHSEESGFLDSVMQSYAQEEDAERVKADGYAERLDENTVRVPDMALFKKTGLGRMRSTHNEGRANLVVEIVSPDSRYRDRGEKFYEHEKAGVEEYWIVDSERRRAEFYCLREGAYEPVLPDAEGKLHSSTLPGFFIRVEWLWNRPKVLGALHELGVLS